MSWPHLGAHLLLSHNTLPTLLAKPAACTLHARAEVIVDELDESSDDDDELAAITGGGAGAGGGAAAVNTAVNARALAQKAAQVHSGFCSFKCVPGRQAGA